MKNLVVAFGLIITIVILGGCQSAISPTASPPTAPAIAPAGPAETAPTVAPSEAPAQPLVRQIVLVTGSGGLGDNSFNDLGWAGVQRAAKDFGLEATVTEPKSLAEFDAIHREIAKSGKYLVIVGLGFEQRDAIAAIAQDYPNQKFVLIDEVIDAPNVASVTFRCREQAFLMGILAAHMTQQTDLKNINPDKTIGMVVGMDVPSIHEFYTGYAAGAKYTDPEVEALFGEVGKWNDPSRGNELALSQYNRGADIVWHVAGGSGLGVFQAAKTTDKYSMGTDTNQNELDPDRIIASTLKKIDNAIYGQIKAAVEGTFAGGAFTLGLKEDGLDVTWEGTNVSIPEAAKQSALEAKQKIIAGEIVPPVDDDALQAFIDALPK